MNDAGVGALFMSLIHTCELNGANPFDYLTELQRHAEESKRSLSLELPVKRWPPHAHRRNASRKPASRKAIS
jgi:hypothetical protein